MVCSFCGQWYSVHNDDGSCVEPEAGREVEAESYAEFAERTFIDPDWKVISPTGEVCTHCGGFVGVDCRCDDLSYIATCDICGGFPGANCHC